MRRSGKGWTAAFAVAIGIAAVACGGSTNGLGALTDGGPDDGHAGADGASSSGGSSGGSGGSSGAGSGGSSGSSGSGSGSGADAGSGSGSGSGSGGSSGGSDSGTAGDGSDGGGTTGNLQCGSAQCTTPVQVCCVGTDDAGATAESCESPTTCSTSGGVSLLCLRTADCPATEVCCMDPTGNTSACALTCGGSDQLCDPNASGNGGCPQGTSCQAGQSGGNLPQGFGATCQ